MKIIYIILLAPLLSISQTEDGIIDAYYQADKVQNDISQFYNFPILDLSNSTELNDLTKKLGDELNTVASCSLYYGYANHLKLSEIEIKLLEQRMKQLAQGFCKLKKYTIFKYTGGYSPISGIDSENRNGKEISIVMSGGGCVVEESDSRARKVREMFNKEMENCISGN